MRRAKRKEIPVQGRKKTVSGLMEVNTGLVLRRLLATLLCIEVVLFVLDAIAHQSDLLPSQIRSILNLTREDSAGTWFMCSIVLFIGITLWLQFARLKKEGAQKKHSSCGVFWQPFSLMLHWTTVRKCMRESVPLST